MGSRDRERRDWGLEDYGRRLTEHTTGNRPSLALPPGLRMFNASKPPFQLDVIPYVLSERSTAFTKNFARVGRRYPERTYFTHRNVGPDDNSYTCPFATYGRRCPICEYRQEKARSPRPEDVETVRALKPSQRQLFLVYDRDNPNNGICLWDVSYVLFGEGLDSKINNASSRKKAAYQQYYHPDDGFTLRIIGKEKKMPKGKPFNEFIIDEFMDRESPVPDEILEHTYCLDEIVREPSYDELKRTFLGMDDDRDGDHDTGRREETRGGRDRDERPARNGDGGYRDRPRGEDKEDTRSAWDRSIGTDIHGRETGRGARDDDRRGRDEPERGSRTRDDDPPPRSRAEKTAEPERDAKPAKDVYTPAVGDFVRFTFLDAELEGEVIDLEPARNNARVEYDGGKTRWVDYEDCKLLDTRPKRRGRDDDPPPRGRAEKVAEPEDKSDPPARSSSAKSGRSESSGSETTSSRGGSKGRGWEDDDDKPAGRGGKDADPEPDEKPARGRGKK